MGTFHSFATGSRVLYMGDHTWFICTVVSRRGFNKINLRPEEGYLPFWAPVSRCIDIPEHAKTIEQVVDMLRRAENWDDKS